MYSIVSTRTVGYRNSILWAKPFEVQVPPELQHLFWKAAPLPYTPDIAFEINPRNPMLDNYFTGTLIHLFSRRLVNLMESNGVHFETFPATIIHPKKDIVLDLDYSIFHLMDVLSALDITKSEVDEQGYVRKIVLRDSFLKRKKMFFRLRHFEEFVLIHEDLIEVFEKNRITGFRYLPIKDFHGWSLTYE